MLSKQPLTFWRHSFSWHLPFTQCMPGSGVFQEEEQRWEDLRNTMKMRYVPHEVWVSLVAHSQTPWLSSTFWKLKTIDSPICSHSRIYQREMHTYTQSPSVKPQTVFLGSVFPVASACSPLTSTDLVSQPCQPLSTLLPGSREQIFSTISWWFGGENKGRNGEGRASRGLPAKGKELITIPDFLLTASGAGSSDSLLSFMGCQPPQKPKLLPRVNLGPKLILSKTISLSLPSQPSHPLSPPFSSFPQSFPASRSFPSLRGFLTSSPSPMHPTHIHLLVPGTPDRELWELPISSHHRGIKVQRRRRTTPGVCSPKLS